jgi:hypothetical protein
MNPWKSLMKVIRKTRQTKAKSREGIFIVEKRKDTRFNKDSASLSKYL